MIKYVYLALSILGILVPYYFGVKIVMETGTFDIVKFIQESTGNNSSAFLAADLSVAALSAMVFIVYEGTSKKIKHWPLALAGIFLVGTSFGFPFFMYLRERAKQKSNHN